MLVAAGRAAGGIGKFADAVEVPEVTVGAGAKTGRTG